MGVFVPFPNGYQAEIIYVLDGQIVENRLWFWTDAPTVTFTDVQGLADGVLAWHAAYIYPWLSSDVTIVDVEVRDWSVSTTPIIAVATAGYTGGYPGESHSANVALSVRFRWPINDRDRKQNKNYVPAIPVDLVDLNTPHADLQDGMFEAYAALIDAARTFSPGDFWYWVVASAYLDGAPRSEMYFNVCIGPVARSQIILGQRRKRLPA